MAHLAVAHEETPSVLDDVDDDMADLEHESKSIKKGTEGEWLPERSPKRSDSLAKSVTEDPRRKHGVWYSRCKKGSEGSSAEIMVMLAELSQSMKDVIGTVDSFGKKIERNVKNLEDHMKEGCIAEGAQGRKDYDNLEENEEEFRSPTRKHEGLI